MFPFTHLQTYQMRYAHHRGIHHPYLESSSASSTSHSSSSVSSAIFVLYDSSSCGNRKARLNVSFGLITSISGHISLNGSSTGSLLSPSSAASKMPNFLHSLAMTALPSRLLMYHRRISATLHAGASRH